MPHSCICFHLPTSRTDHLCVRDCALALRYRVLIYHKSQLVEIISWCMADYEVSCYKFRRVGHTHTINAFIGGDVIATIAQLLWFAFDHSAKRQHNHPKRIVFKTTSIYLVMYLIICIYMYSLVSGMCGMGLLMPRVAWCVSRLGILLIVVDRREFHFDFDRCVRPTKRQ